MENNYRLISQIANEIRKDWKNPNYAARPYLDAMNCLDEMSDYFYNDSAQSVILYFLSNASAWHGETAKRIKLELKAMIANKPVKFAA